VLSYNTTVVLSASVGEVEATKNVNANANDDGSPSCNHPPLPIPPLLADPYAGLT